MHDDVNDKNKSLSIFSQCIGAKFIHDLFSRNVAGNGFVYRFDVMIIHSLCGSGVS